MWMQGLLQVRSRFYCCLFVRDKCNTNSEKNDDSDDEFSTSHPIQIADEAHEDADLSNKTTNSITKLIP